MASCHSCLPLLLCSSLYCFRPTGMRQVTS